MKTRKPPTFLSAAAVAAAALLAIPTASAQLVVTNTEDREPATGDPAPPGSLRDAIENVPAGGTITFAPELSGQSISINGRITIGKSMTIDASGLAAAADGGVGITLRGGYSSYYYDPEFGIEIIAPSSVLGVAAGVADVTLNSLGIRDGSIESDGQSAAGLGILNRGEVVLNDCSVSGHSAYIDFEFGANFGEDISGAGGLGISNRSGATMVLNRCRVTGNRAGRGSTSGNSGGSGGSAGGIRNSGTMTLNDCVVANNSAGFGGSRDGNHQGRGAGNPGGSGGGFYNTGTLTINDSEIAHNHAGRGGFQGGVAGNGGGIYNTGTLVIRRSTLHSNGTADGQNNLNEGFDFYQGGAGSSGGSGGAIYSARGSVSIEDSTVFENSTGDGGDSENVQLFGHRGGSGGNGGGICVQSGSLTALRCQLAHNSTGRGGWGAHSIYYAGDPDVGADDVYSPGGAGGAGGRGGAICAEEGAIIVACSMTGNVTGRGGNGGSAEGEGGRGGWGAGLYVAGESASVQESTFSNNRTGNGGNGGNAGVDAGLIGLGGLGGAGGGIYFAADTSSLQNSTVFGNATGNGGLNGDDGFGVFPNEGGWGAGVASAGHLEIEHCTITSNHSDGRGGGVDQGSAAGATVSLANSIVAGNSVAVTGPDFYGTISGSSGVNLIGDTDASSGVRGSDITGVDPMLAPLGNYGGSTATRLPMPGSPVIDVAGVSGQTGDQRGLPRGASPDIGAVEFQPGDSDLVWLLDSDGDGSPRGVELAVGSDPATSDPGHPGNLRVASEAGAAVLSFGRSAGAPAGTVWSLTRSDDLVSYEEIYRFDGTVESAADGVTSQLGADQIAVQDSDPPAGAAAYRLEVLRAP